MKTDEHQGLSKQNPYTPVFWTYRDQKPNLGGSGNIQKKGTLLPRILLTVANCLNLFKIKEVLRRTDISQNFKNENEKDN